MNVPDCPFCRIVAGTDEARIVWRSPEFVAFLPLEPATRGHTLVVPVDHIETVFDLTAQQAASLGSATWRIAAAVREAANPEGMNLIQSNGDVATQTVGHVHVHVLPRWADDRIPDFWPDGTLLSEAEMDGIAKAITDAAGSEG